MSDDDDLARWFERNRTHLRAVAYRMLGSTGEADDAVQETWLRFRRTDTGDVTNLRGWLTTVVSRVCLDMLRARATRREDPLDLTTTEPPVDDEAPDPEREALLADAVGPALLLVLETLAPAERLAFVLHDLFGVPFDEVATVVNRSPAAARQLASRARRRVRQQAPAPSADKARQRELVDAFLAAAHEGDFDALLSWLDPDIVVRPDDTAVRLGAAGEIRGARDVATVFVGGGKGALRAIVDGMPGGVWAPGGRPRVVFTFTLADDRISGIDVIADPARLDAMDLVILGN